jgi:hypothetical protein
MNDSCPAKLRSHRFLVSVSVALGDIMWLAGDGASARASGMRARGARQHTHNAVVDACSTDSVLISLLKKGFLSQRDL